MLIRFILFSIIAGLLTSCGFTRNRAGYYPLEEKDPLKCVVKVATLATIDNLKKEEVGRLRLGEAPFLEYPWLCDKEDALKVIRDEACNANANFANIVYENYPGFFQSCYHCVVVFYRIPASEKEALQKAIVASQAAEPDPNPQYPLTVLGKIIKTMAIVGAAIGITRILKLTEI